MSMAIRPAALMVFTTAALWTGTSSVLFAQAAATAPAKPPSPSTAEATAAPTPQQSGEEALARAKGILDRMDAGEGDEALAGALEELNREILELQSADPAHPWLAYLLGRAYALSGRSGDAIDQLRRFVETRDGRNEWKAFRVLGDLFVGEFPRLAKANYVRAAELNPNEPSVLLGLSLCAGKMGERDATLGFARRAAEADGGRSVRYANHLARTLASMKKWDDAEREALTALRLAEEIVRRQPGRRGPLQTVSAQYDLLIDIVGGRLGETSGVGSDEYIRIADYMTWRAEIAVQVARHDRLAVLEQGVKKAGASPSPRILAMYASALVEVGRADDAITQYERLLAIEPENAAAREGLAELRRTGGGSDPAP